MSFSGIAVLGNRVVVAALVSRCQLLAGRLRNMPPFELLAEISRAATELPFDNLGMPERAVVGSLLVQALSRWAGCAQVAHHSAVAYGFLELSQLPPASDAWRRSWTSLLETCRAAAGSSHADQQALAVVQDPRTARLVTVIAERYREPDLRLRDIAGAINCSTWHAARLLTRHTGQGFVGHLREQRLAEAERLLAQAFLSVKQIAAEAGYTSARQFTRDFKRLRGVTPRTFRRRVVALGAPTGPLVNFCRSATTKKGTK